MLEARGAGLVLADAVRFSLLRDEEEPGAEKP